MPEVLADDLLGDIHDFSTPASVNPFLGNLIKQLACKRIARRDAIALAYISQLLLNSFPALEKAAAAEKKGRGREGNRSHQRLIRQQARERAARRFNNPPIAPSSFALTDKWPSARARIVREVRRNLAARLIAPSKRLG